MKENCAFNLTVLHVIVHNLGLVSEHYPSIQKHQKGTVSGEKQKQFPFFVTIVVKQSRLSHHSVG